MTQTAHNECSREWFAGRAKLPATDWCDQIAWVAAMRPTTGGQLGCTTALPPLGQGSGPPPSPHSVFHWSRDLKDLLLAANQHQQHQEAKLRLTLRLHLDSNLVRWQVLPSPVVQMLPSLVVARVVLSCCGKCCPCCPLLWCRLRRSCAWRPHCGRLCP